MKHSTSSKHEGPHCHIIILDGLPVNLCQVLRETSQHLRTWNLPDLLSVSCPCLASSQTMCSEARESAARQPGSPAGSSPPVREEASQGSPHGGPSRAAMGFVSFVISLQTAGPTTPPPWYAWNPGTGNIKDSAILFLLPEQSSGSATSWLFW